MATLAKDYNTMTDAPSFHRNTTGLVQHLILDTNNAFYTDAVTGLSVESISASGDDNAVVTFASGDDLSKVMKFSQLQLINTTASSNRSNDGLYDIISVDNTSKTILIYAPQIQAQAAAGGVANVNPLYGANFIECLEDDTTFSSLVEHEDFIGGDVDKLQGLTWAKNDQKFGVFTEIVVTAGSVRIALL